MSEKRAATDQVSRNLHDAIERVREDMARVEFWAEAVTGFSEPVPDYEAKDANVWVPREQAKKLSPAAPDNDGQRAVSNDQTIANGRNTATGSR